MPRPLRCRRVCCRPAADYFEPRGTPVTCLDEVTLQLDELEAIRLADLEQMYQEDAAKKMNISRQTFGNIIDSGHRKIADCLVHGKALRIKGGAIEMVEKYFVCCDCKHEWTLPYGAGRPAKCPKCEGVNIHRAPQDRGWARAGRGPGRGRCRRMQP